jgi:hypothetical protein
MFDISKIFQHFGVIAPDVSRRQLIQDLQHRMKLAGRHVSAKNVEGWFSRSRVSVKGLADFAYLARFEGLKFDLTQFLKVDE